MENCSALVPMIFISWAIQDLELVQVHINWKCFISTWQHFFSIPFSEPVEGLEAHTIVHVACGSNHTLAQNEWGEIFAWGANDFGQLGLNVQSPAIQFPKMIKYLATKQVVQIACGQHHSLALTNGKERHVLAQFCEEKNNHFSWFYIFVVGELYAWGCNR